MFDKWNKIIVHLVAVSYKLGFLNKWGVREECNDICIQKKWDAIYPFSQLTFTVQIWNITWYELNVEHKTLPVIGGICKMYN